MKKIALFVLPVIFLFNACALEIANVIGPGGGYVYYDKGNYESGWRYKECSPFDLGELKKGVIKNIDDSELARAVQLCEEQTDPYYSYLWEIPDEADLKKMLECFSYGLTRFSPDYYYLAADKTIQISATYDPKNSATWRPNEWGIVILHKNFDSAANGVVEKVATVPDQKTIRVRPVRKF